VKIPQLYQETVVLVVLKGLKIPVFDGSPEKWPYFCEVVDAHLHHITNWHNIKEKDRDAFEQFADTLQAAVFALDKPDYRHELSSMPLCTQLVRKLPPSEKDEWVRQVEHKQVTENVKGLSEYAQLRVKSLCNTCTTQRRPKV
jgi:hypothetical protein